MPYELYRDESGQEFYVKVLDTNTEGRTWKTLQVGELSAVQVIQNKIGQAHLLPGMCREKLAQIMTMVSLDDQMRAINDYLHSRPKLP